MTDVVQAPATPQEKTVKAPKEPKPKAPPKEPRFRKGLDSAKWAEKLASMTQATVPEGYLGMSEICKKANDQDIKTSRIVSAMGGDRGWNPPWDPIFQVVYVGNRKFGSPAILDKGFALLKDPEYHKTARVGRAKKEPELGPDGKPLPKKETPPKIKVSAEAAKPWVAKPE